MVFGSTTFYQRINEAAIRIAEAQRIVTPARQTADRVTEVAEKKETPKASVNPVNPNRFRIF